MQGRFLARAPRTHESMVLFTLRAVLAWVNGASRRAKGWAGKKHARSEIHPALRPEGDKWSE